MCVSGQAWLWQCAGADLLACAGLWSFSIRMDLQRGSQTAVTLQRMYSHVMAAVQACAAAE